MEPRLACLACLDRTDPRLLEAALWIAAEHRQALEPRVLLRSLDDLALQLDARLDGDASHSERAQALLRQLCEAGFRAAEWPLRPGAALLDEVLARRRGQPLSIALVALELARRLEINLQGIGFPGHFLLRVPGADHLLEPFGGRRLYMSDCRQLLVDQFGANARLQATHLAPLTPRQMMQRLSRNLRELHRQGDQPLAALKDAQRVIELGAAGVADHLARADLYRQLECPQAERYDLQHALLISEDDAERDQLRRRLERLGAPATTLH
ncbi:transglutaminase family protein [uncultured Pseudomonas sp.]|uniref:SirB1 family protein n=1 Tax=uncultured Pseudomonas sp. TaxID=114707 RepID=UPI0025D8CCAC|nr:transglutaminase family protein [uncultured Pseudomonas sp.]